MVCGLGPGQQRGYSASRGFDPFPYTLLTTLVSLEAIFLSIFLLINQNVMSRQADHRAHLDLQVNLLAEQEATQMLRMMARVCRKLDVEIGDLYRELAGLEKKTDVHQLGSELKDSLPSDSEGQSDPPRRAKAGQVEMTSVWPAEMSSSPIMNM